MRALSSSTRAPLRRLEREVRILFSDDSQPRSKISNSVPKSANAAMMQVRCVHQGVNVRPMNMQNLHSMAEASYIPETPDVMAGMDWPDAAEFGYRVVPLSQECRYTSTATDRDGLIDYYYGDQNNYAGVAESSSSFVNEAEAMHSSGEILDIIESQREWDELVADEKRS